MIKYSYTSNRNVAPFYSLMFMLLIIILGLLSGCGTSTSGPASKQGLKGTIREFTLPVPNSVPVGITKGPDGNIWFTENIPTTQSDKSTGKIGRITPTGKISEFPLPTPNATLGHITTGPDGNLWFTEVLNDTDTGKIGRITPAGKISEFLLPYDSLPNGITTGPDGNLWFTTSYKIGRITPAGKISEFLLPVTAYIDERAGNITTGPDGNLWFTDSVLNIQSNKSIGKIGRITPAGKISEFTLPTPESQPISITTGPDGALWFPEDFNNGQNGKIGRITPAGKLSEFPLPAPNSVVYDITTGPDDALWFTENVGTAQNGKIVSVNKIGRITSTGSISEFTLPDPNILIESITPGLNSTLWFTEPQNSKIGSFA